MSSIKTTNPERTVSQSEISPYQPEIGFRPEQLAERPSFGAEKINETPIASSVANQAAYQAVVNPQTESYKKIENILEEDLGEIFFKLTPLEQEEFKKKGEETASLIMDLLAKSKVQIKKIIEAIKDWLKLIPGINRFFLEQEAKIKADKIVNSFIAY